MEALDAPADRSRSDFLNQTLFLEGAYVVADLAEFGTQLSRDFDRAGNAVGQNRQGPGPKGCEIAAPSALPVFFSPSPCMLPPSFRLI
jgi:hypothetical protein